MRSCTTGAGAPGVTWNRNGNTTSAKPAPSASTSRRSARTSSKKPLIARSTRALFGSLNRRSTLSISRPSAFSTHAHERRARVQARQPARRTREVVEELRDVVEADGEHRRVRAGTPRAMRAHAIRSCRVDQPHSATLITSTGRPSAAKRASSCCGYACSGLRPSAERDAVAEDGHAPHEVGLLVRAGAVAQAVGVELLPRRPAGGVGLHHVEAAGHLVVPVPDVVGDARPGRLPPLDETRPTLQRQEEQDRDDDAQRDVDDEPVPPQAAALAAWRSAAAILSQCVPCQ